MTDQPRFRKAYDPHWILTCGCEIPRKENETTPPAFGCFTCAKCGQPTSICGYGHYFDDPTEFVKSAMRP